MCQLKGLNCQITRKHNCDLIELLVVDVVWTAPRFPLTFEVFEVKEASWGGWWSRKDHMMLGRSLLLHFILEGAYDEEKVEHEKPAADAAGDVHDGWVECNAEYDAEDVEEKADSSDDEPRHHEADIFLKWAS